MVSDETNHKEEKLLSCYKHLTIKEREKLYEMRILGEGIRKIAKELGRSPSTVSRELQRNPGQYSPSDAQTAYRTRRKNSVRKYVLAEPELNRRVRFHLGRMYWSPEQIANRLRREGRSFVSTATIYRALDNGVLRDTLRYYLRFKYKTHGKAKKRGKSCFRRSITERPAEANDRAPGHWEGDTVVSAKGRQVIATVVDRNSRYLVTGLAANKEAASINKIIIKQLTPLKDQVKSITFDQGTEFSQPGEIEEQLDTDVFFAHPHSPWERPTNENTNGLLRQFIPKHRNLNDLTEEDLSFFTSLLNLRPRKCLDWLSPYEAFWHSLLHFT